MHPLNAYECPCKRVQCNADESRYDKGVQAIVTIIPLTSNEILFLAKDADL